MTARACLPVRAPMPRTAAPAVALLALATLAGCTPGRHTARSSPGRATITRVVDGDTVVVSLGGTTERVRLLGIDTPETVKPNTPVQCYGPEASARTKHLLPAGTVVRLQRDREARDAYGRLLAYLWRDRDGLFINRSLVAGGYARILSITPNTAHAAELSAAAADARQARRGLWGACGPSS